MRTLFSLLLIGASITIFVVVIRPRYQNLTVARAAVLVAQTNIETAKKLAESRDALIATYSTIPKADLDNLRPLLPDSVDNIRLIIQINSLATKNGLSLLRNVEYQTEDVAAKTGKTMQDPETANRSYGEFTISFQTTGQYANFLTFIADLERNLRLVDVTNVDFTTNENPTVQNPASSLSYKVTLKTYWLKQ